MGSHSSLYPVAAESQGMQQIDILSRKLVIPEPLETSPWNHDFFFSVTQLRCLHSQGIEKECWRAHHSQPQAARIWDSIGDYQGGWPSFQSVWVWELAGSGSRLPLSIPASPLPTAPSRFFGNGLPLEVNSILYHVLTHAAASIPFKRVVGSQLGC